MHGDQAIPFGPYQIAARKTGSVKAGADNPALPNLDEKGTATEPYPIIAVTFGDTPIARRWLRRQLTIVGRLRPSDLPIHHNDMSAEHLAFFWDSGTLWVIDLHSRMGTWIEGNPIDCAELPLGCSLTVGEVGLTFVGLHSSRRGADAGLGTAFGPLALPSDIESPPSVPEEDEEPPASAEPGKDPLHFMAQWRAQMEVEQRHQHEAIEKERRAMQTQLARWSASVDRLRGELTRQQQALRNQQREWDAQHKQQEGALDHRASELERWQATLEIEQKRIQARREQLDGERAEWETDQQKRLETDRLHEERLCAIQAEQKAIEEQFREQLALIEQLRTEVERRHEELSPAAGPSAATEVANAAAMSDPAGSPVPLRAWAPVPLPKPAPAPVSAPQEFDASYDEVLDRLMQVSRSRSSWWARFREAWNDLRETLSSHLSARCATSTTGPSDSAKS